MAEVTHRSYRPADRAACLAIFDSNVPKYLAAEEREDFDASLSKINADDRPTIVFVEEGFILACGGLIFQREKRHARFSWGLVHGQRHGEGHGTRLTELRLALAQTEPGIDSVGLATTQKTYRFFERFGFVTIGVTPDSVAPGLDQYDMVVQL
ncbi:MAG: GNAT family N-acetyltransferase [Pseudomonadota bacterium]